MLLISPGDIWFFFLPELGRQPPLAIAALVCWTVAFAFEARHLALRDQAAGEGLLQARI